MPSALPAIIAHRAPDFRNLLIHNRAKRLAGHVGNMMRTDLATTLDDQPLPSLVPVWRAARRRFLPAAIPLQHDCNTIDLSH
jgi:hypothetical protein